MNLRLLADRAERRTTALTDRLRSILLAIGLAADASADLAALRAPLESQLRSDRPDVWWLVLAVINGRLPTTNEVQVAARACDFDGAHATLSTILDGAKANGSRLRGQWAPVHIAVGAVLVDLHHTSRTELATGIQRVARQAARRWNDSHDITLVGWSDRFTHLLPLDAERSRVALYGAESPPHGAGSPRHGAESPRHGDGSPRPGSLASHTDGNSAPETEAAVIVPWRGTYLLPELMTERDRALRLQALVSFSNSRTAAIGFDCVPLTSAETIGEGMGGGFSINLTAIARMDRVATISEAAAVEYRGWRAMLAGAGLTGPQIAPIPLAVEAGKASTESVEQVRRELAVGTVPMILVVGSHEPRKNHLAILHAAEVLWREGLRFTLTFVGGNAWRSERFATRLTELQSVGRPVQGISALSDDMLWAAYEVASFTVFPSLNEGFGLPVAESLATGTPVITANYGSMREIADAGGALLVDPRSDAELADAIRTLLTHPDVHATLAAEAAMVPVKSWDTYAHEVWHHLVESEDRAVAAGAALESGIR